MVVEYDVGKHELELDILDLLSNEVPSGCVDPILTFDQVEHDDEQIVEHLLGHELLAFARMSSLVEHETLEFDLFARVNHRKHVDDRVGAVLLTSKPVGVFQVVAGGRYSPRAACCEQLTRVVVVVGLIVANGKFHVYV